MERRGHKALRWRRCSLDVTWGLVWNQASQEFLGLKSVAACEALAINAGARLRILIERQIDAAEL
jgi:hypothetical protein